MIKDTKRKYWISTHCKSVIILSEDDKKEYGDYNIAYFIENFSNNEKIMKEFLRDLVFIKKKTKDEKNIYTYVATGKNNIMVFFNKDNHYDRPVNSSLCNITFKLINNIYEYSYEKYGYYYSDSFILQYLNIDKACMKHIIYEDTKLYISIDLKKSYFESNPKIIELDKDNIKDKTFIIMLKCDNYDDIRKSKMDEQTKMNKIREEFQRSRFRSIFYLTYGDIGLLKTINETVKSLFSNKYDVCENNIQININIATLNSMWIRMYVTINRHDIAEYNYKRLTLSLNSILIDDLCDLLENTKDLYNESTRIGVILENKYKISIPHNMGICENMEKMEEYDKNYYRTHRPDKSMLEIYRENPEEEISYNYLENKFNKNNDFILEEGADAKTLNITEKRKTYNIISNNKFSDFFNKNVTIHRITDIKESRISSLCSKTICISIKNNHFIINIIPRTIEYINYKQNKGNILRYITNNNKKVERICGENNIYVTNDKLVYIIEMVKIDPYDCTCCNTSHKFENNYIDRHIIDSHKQSIYLIMKENYEMSEILLKLYEKNFIMSLFTVLHNVIKNLLIYMKYDKKDNDNVKHENFVKVKQIIIDIENIFNNKIKDTKYKKTIFAMQLDLLYNDETREINMEFGMISKDPKCSFYCVPVNEYIEYKYNKSEKEFPYRLLIWYTVPLIDDINNIIETAEKIKEYINNYNSNIEHTLSLTPIRREEINYIYGENNNVISDFLYNICSLVKHPEKKCELDNFLKEVFEELEIKWQTIVYHYYTGTDTLGLHLHIYPKKFIHSAQQAQTIIGYRANFSHELSKYYAHDYSKFEIKIWSRIHYTYYRIFCVVTFRKIINDYLEENNIDITNINNYHIYQIIMNGIKQNIILNLFGEMTNEPIFKKYIEKIIKFNKNHIINVFNAVLKSNT